MGGALCGDRSPEERAALRLRWNVEIPNAFIGKIEKPTNEELLAVLGPSAKLWNEYVDWMAAELGVATQEWKGVCVKKYGWALRLKVKARNIVYLSPCAGCFRVAFVLGDKAVAAARAAELPENASQALAESTRYPEGTGLRLIVKKAGDLSGICRLAEIKLAN
jgi:hypothetical protein